MFRVDLLKIHPVYCSMASRLFFADFFAFAPEYHLRQYRLQLSSSRAFSEFRLRQFQLRIASSRAFSDSPEIIFAEFGFEFHNFRLRPNYRLRYFGIESRFCVHMQLQCSSSQPCLFGFVLHVNGHHVSALLSSRFRLWPPKMGTLCPGSMLSCLCGSAYTEYIYMQICIYIYICVYRSLYLYIRVNVYIYIYIYIYGYMCICMNICVNV